MLRDKLAQNRVRLDETRNMSEMDFPQYECMEARDRATQEQVAEERSKRTRNWDASCPSYFMYVS